MSTVFEKMIAGEIPGRFVWSDEECVAFLTIEPITAGHALVVPRQAWAKWTEVPPATIAHLMTVAQILGQAQETGFEVPRSGLIIAGFEVPHTHLHVVPMHSEEDLTFARAHAATTAELNSAAATLRASLIAKGHQGNVPPDVSSPQL